MIPLRVLSFTLIAMLVTSGAFAASDTAESTRAKQDVLWKRATDSIGTIVQQTDA